MIWPTARLGQLGRVVTGRTPPAAHPEYWGDELPFLTPTDMDGGRLAERFGRRLSKVGAHAMRSAVVPYGVGVSCIGWQMGKAVYIGSPVLTNQQINTIVFDSKIVDGLYLYYVMSSRREEIFRLGSGGSRTPILNKTSFEDLTVHVPPRAEQCAISSVLGAIDDKIELNNRMNRTLEELAATIFKSWFVDFDPVVAKREGKTPVGVPAEALDRFPSHFEDSALGPIPKAWRAGTLGEVATNPRSGVSPNDVGSEVPYIGLEHMPQRSICLDAWGHAGQATSGKFRFKQGDFLFGKLRPYFHKVGVALVDGVCSTDILVLNPTRHAYYAFVLGHISSREFIDYNDASSGGTRMPRTSWDVVARYQIAIPPAETADVLNEITTPLLQQLRANVEETHTLAEMRDLLLPPLLSGEITLKAAEKTVAEVV